MALNLVTKLRAVIENVHPRDGGAGAVDLMETLKQSYYGLLRLAAQIQGHAEKAPYSHVAQRLEQLALEKGKSGDLLRDKILQLGGTPGTPQLDLKSGKNHWERIDRDIEDQRVLLSKLLQSAVRCAEEAPQISNLLRQIAAVETSHVETLLQLLMRADPQADQN
jgi:bacterioferritin (cytochrome b1)